jgi:quercetin dioxygenase-like cupin family protein
MGDQVNAAPREIANRSTGERVVFLRTAQETGGTLLEMDDFWTRADHHTPEHVHPAMEERWEVIAGSVRFEIDGVTQSAAVGETVIAPPGTPHSAFIVVAPNPLRTAPRSASLPLFLAHPTNSSSRLVLRTWRDGNAGRVPSRLSPVKL